MARDPRKTYSNDWVLRSLVVGYPATSPGIGTSTSPSRLLGPFAHLSLASTPMTINPPGDGTATTATVATTGSTLTPASSNCRVNPGGNVTGIILAVPPTGDDGNLVFITNESAFTLTFAADATSHVFNGTSITIPAKCTVPFIWDSKLSTAGLWTAGAPAVAANLAGNQAISGNMVITSNSANALAVGRQGSTNPVLNVDASTALQVTGLDIKGAAASGGVAVTTTSSGAAEALTIDSLGTGTLSLNATATGNVIIGSALQMTTAVSKLVPGATSFAIRNNADAANNVLIADAGGVTLRSTLTFAAATSQVIPGATSLSFRNNAGAADNLLIADSGLATFRTNIAFAAASAKLIPGATSLLIRNNADSASNIAITDAGAVSLGGSAATLTVTSAQAAALAVGLNGATNPALEVDASTALSATGIKIKSAAAGSGVALSAISTGAESLTIDAATTGQIQLGTTSTGLIVLARGAAKGPIIGSTMTGVNAQNASPTAAQLLGGYIEHTTQTAGGTVTTPTGANLSAAVAGLAVGDTFSCVYANIGNQTGTITAGDGNVTLRGTVAVPAGKDAQLQLRNTGANTWTIYINLSA